MFSALFMITVVFDCANFGSSLLYTVHLAIAQIFVFEKATTTTVTRLAQPGRLLSRESSAYCPESGSESESGLSLSLSLSLSLAVIRTLLSHF